MNRAAPSAGASKDVEKQQRNEEKAKLKKLKGTKPPKIARLSTKNNVTGVATNGGSAKEPVMDTSTGAAANGAAANGAAANGAAANGAAAGSDAAAAATAGAGNTEDLQGVTGSAAKYLKPDARNQMIWRSTKNKYQEGNVHNTANWKPWGKIPSNPDAYLALREKWLVHPRPKPDRFF
jgi:hypothetical protein